jgi:biotin synthase-like enzyme
VVAELRQLVDRGFQHLHLCDSEFNEDLEYCETLLRAINREGLELRWGLYMKPGNASPELFELLRESGAYLVTLAVDTYRRGKAYWKQVASMMALCRAAGIRISIDLITGFPHESETVLREVIDFLKELSPDEVVVNVFIRLYQELPLARVIDQDPSLQDLVFAPGGEKGSLLPPVFYNHVPLERLLELVQGDPRFRIAGQEKVVNYQKAEG